MPVVDASVVLKWFIEETDSPAALTLRDAHRYQQTSLLAPDLLLYEVANVLLHHPRWNESEVVRAVEALVDLQLDLIAPTPEVIKDAIRLASRWKLTFYDALYVGVAQALEMELITADRQLHRCVSHLPFVHLLH